jgi:hypothetical protein
MILVLKIKHCIKHRSQPAVLASAWCLFAKMWAKLGIRMWWVPPPYGFGSTQTCRRMFIACKTFSAFELLAGYGFTPSMGDRCACPVRPRAHNALRASVSLLTKNHIVHCSTCRAQNKCIVRAYSALPQFNCPKRTQNSGEPYRASTCSALTTPRMWPPKKHVGTKKTHGGLWSGL